MVVLCCVLIVFFFKQKTAYEMRISDWSSDVCSSDLAATAKTMGEVFKFGPDERVLSYLQLAHVAECIGVEGNSLYHGFRVYFAESLDKIGRASCRERVCQYV